MKINVLGTDYTLKEATESTDNKLVGKDGYCDTSVKLCVVDKMDGSIKDAKNNLPAYKRNVIRHELIHAFLFESGLDANSWAWNEEMVDWIAIQFPKLLKAFRNANAITGEDTE